MAAKTQVCGATRAFSLIELLVVIFILAVLMAVSLPVVRSARAQARGVVCKSHLRQVGLSLTQYLTDNEQAFPEPKYLYHSPQSFPNRNGNPYPTLCRWHDKEYALDGSLMRNNPGYQGALYSYLGNFDVVLCSVNSKANLSKGCGNPEHGKYPPPIPVDPQYSYTMNALLRGKRGTGRLQDPEDDGMMVPLIGTTIREFAIANKTQVTRSPSEVCVFGEENSWQTGGGVGLSDLDVIPTYILMAVVGVEVQGHGDSSGQGSKLHPPGDSFATSHHPPQGNLNKGHSYIVMLDGHTKKVTVHDQKRASALEPDEEPGQFGYGGIVAAAWPLDIPPIGGWHKQ